MFQLSILNIINIVIIEDKESFYDLRNIRLAILCHEWVSEWESRKVVSNSLRPLDYTVYEIFQARILEWVAFPFSRGSSQHRDGPQVSRIASVFFTSWATREAHTLSYSLLTQNGTELLDVMPKYVLWKSAVHHASNLRRLEISRSPYNLLWIWHLWCVKIFFFLIYQVLLLLSHGSPKFGSHGYYLHLRYLTILVCLRF